MFKCDQCGNSPPPKTPAKKIIVAKRRFLHPERPRAKKGLAILKNGKTKVVWIPDPGGWGDQIVHEAKMCPDCAFLWNRDHAKVA
jgi:hypothetical protein